MPTSRPVPGSTTRLAAVASVLADDTRSRILLALMDGRARTGRELAVHIGVAPSTVSGHVSRLLDAGLVAMEAQGRHRYVRLAGPEVAHLIETLEASTPAATLAEPRVPSALRHLRTCYDHLAGRVAVDIRAGMVASGRLLEGDDGDRLTADGRAFLDDLGLDLVSAGSSRRPTVGRCLDWSERRPHLSGRLGAALLAVLRRERWVAPGPTPRSLRLTEAGRRQLPARFDLVI